MLHKNEACKELGPGGMKCHCCGPKPGKDRKEFRRLERTRLNRSFVRRAELEHGPEDFFTDIKERECESKKQ